MFHPLASLYFNQMDTISQLSDMPELYQFLSQESSQEIYNISHEIIPFVEKKG